MVFVLLFFVLVVLVAVVVLVVVLAASGSSHVMTPPSAASGTTAGATLQANVASSSVMPPWEGPTRIEVEDRSVGGMVEPAQSGDTSMPVPFPEMVCLRTANAGEGGQSTWCDITVRSTITAAPLYWGVASAETDSAVVRRTSRGAKVFIVVNHYTLAICVSALRWMSLSSGRGGWQAFSSGPLGS